MNYIKELKRYKSRSMILSMNHYYIMINKKHNKQEKVKTTHHYRNDLLSMINL